MTVTLAQALARLDALDLNWEDMAHRISIMSGVDITAEQCRALARAEITEVYREASYE